MQGVQLHSQSPNLYSRAVNHKFSGQGRSVYMWTENEGDLKDFNALATGGYLKYVAKGEAGWELGAALYNSLKLRISNLQLPDPVTGRLSRYEEGLFNRLDLDKTMVSLLGESYVSYAKGLSTLTVGRFKVNTPQINPQDGRMIPTLVQGIWFKRGKQDKLSIQAGILNRIAPRSTGTFMKIGESIGTYPAGRDVNGNPSKYAGNTYSQYVAIANTEWYISPSIQFNLWNYYTDNISNTLYLKPEWDISKRLGLDAEWLHQNRVGEGGNSDPELRYFTQNQSDIVGLQLRYTLGKSQIQFGYDRILPGGRFLFPREWGREYLFSFQKLERSEGSADNHALVVSYAHPLTLKREVLKLRPILSFGRHWKASVLNAQENKYAFPDYTHLNLDVFVDFMKLPNLRPELLLTYKDAAGSFPTNPNFVINKVNLFHVSFIVNYNF